MTKEDVIENIEIIKSQIPETMDKYQVSQMLTEIMRMVEIINDDYIKQLQSQLLEANFIKQINNL